MNLLPLHFRVLSLFLAREASSNEIPTGLSGQVKERSGAAPVEGRTQVKVPCMPDASCSQLPAFPLKSLTHVHGILRLKTCIVEKCQEHSLLPVFTLQDSKYSQLSIQFNTALFVAATYKVRSSLVPCLCIVSGG